MSSTSHAAGRSSSSRAALRILYSVESDLADTRDAGEVFERTFGSLAALDCDEIVAINNAAVLAPVGPSALADPAAVLRSVDVNVTAGVSCSPAEFLRAVRSSRSASRRSSTSQAVRRSRRTPVVAVLGGQGRDGALLSSACSRQSAQHSPVRVFSVNPVVMDTSMQAEVRASDPGHFPELDRVVGLKRDGLLRQSPDDVAMQIVDLVQSRPEPGGTYALSRYKGIERTASGSINLSGIGRRSCLTRWVDVPR